MINGFRKTLRSNFVLPISLVVGLILRMINITSPFIGRHAWNEALYGSMPMDMFLHGNWYPAYVQFVRPDFNLGPFFFWFGYFFLRITGPTEFSLRLVSIIASVVSIWLVYKIVLKISSSKEIASFSSLVFASIPMMVYYGSRYQPEALTYMLYLLSFYFLLLFLEDFRSLDLVLSGLFLGISFIVKSNLILLYFPMFFALIIRLKQKKALGFFNTIGFIVTASFPVLIWLALESLAYPDLYPYKYLLTRLFVGPRNLAMVLGGTILSFDAGIGYFKGFYMAFGPLVFVGIIGIILSKENKLHYYSLFLFSMLFALIGIWILDIHTINHEYDNILMVLPLTLFSAITYRRVYLFLIKKINYPRFFEFIFVVIIIGSTIPFNISYRMSRDAFGNLAAVETGKYIQSITNLEDTVLVQSPVIGYYTQRPNLHWGFLWIPNASRVASYGIRDLLTGKTIMEHDSFYNKDIDPDWVLNVFKYWNFKVIVISPDISDTFSSNPDLHPIGMFLSRKYEKKNIIKPYTILIKKNETTSISNNEIELYYQEGHVEFYWNNVYLASNIIFVSPTTNLKTYDNARISVGANSLRIMYEDEQKQYPFVLSEYSLVEGHPAISQVSIIPDREMPELVYKHILDETDYTFLSNVLFVPGKGVIFTNVSRAGYGTLIDELSYNFIVLFSTDTKKAIIIFFDSMPYSIVAAHSLKGVHPIIQFKVRTNENPKLTYYFTQFLSNKDSDNNELPDDLEQKVDHIVAWYKDKRG